MLDKDSLLSEEALLIIDGGEIPEVALHSSVYYLTVDPEGPGLTLEPADLLLLKEIVVKRYGAIILRDLTHENRDRRIYRGVARSAVNWQRLKRFAHREGLSVAAVRREVAEALRVFLRRELAYVANGRRTSCVNCNASSLEELARDVGLDPDHLPDGWRTLCPRK